MALSKKYRLPLRFERTRINKEGHPVSGRYLTVISSPSPLLDYPRFAFLVSKKVSPLATDRNRIRRQFTEIVSSLLPKIKVKDYLLIPKKSALSCSYDLLDKDIQSILNVSPTH